ncbi:MAG: hypothetical protein AAFX79_04595 [Planctomycetota bacterium]
MAGPLSKRPSARTLLRVTLVLLAIMAVAPMRYTRWTSAFSDLALTVTAPVSHAIKWVADPLTRPLRPGADPALAEQYKQELDASRKRALDLEVRVEELEALVLELQRGLALTPDVDIRQVAAPVIGRLSDPASIDLQVRAGSGRGVVPNAVAVVEGLQLLGRVERTTAAWCIVRPITSSAAGGIDAVVLTGEDLASGVACRLEPTGDGLLRGPATWVFEPSRQGPVELAAGLTVRLRDDTWPGSAQMLVLGEVVAVEPAADEPTRTIVTVSPLVPLERVSEVVLRVPLDPTEDETVGDVEGGP